jgi:putative hemin transport protein
MQSSPSSDLAARWNALRAATPGIRARDAADALGVSEAELVASRIGAGTVRLKPEWKALFERLPSLGRVMALTRNEHCVHERRGVYAKASFEGHVGLVLGAEIDLRIFLSHWAFGFAVEEESRNGLMRSIQVFDRSGTAVHKVYAGEGTDLDAWAALIGALREPTQSGALDVAARKPPKPPLRDHEIDVVALLDDWQGMKDTHEFFAVLRRHRVQPNQAFRLAEGRFTARLGNGTVREMLQAASNLDVPIMVFVGNPGLIQIHSGPVKRIQMVGEWLNVLDPDFNLHLRQDRIAEVWCVEKPTTDGVVTSVEAFDAAGERIATFFGKRKPGEPELQAWRALAHALSGRPVAA